MPFACVDHVSRTHGSRVNSFLIKENLLYYLFFCFSLNYELASVRVYVFGLKN